MPNCKGRELNSISGEISSPISLYYVQFPKTAIREGIVTKNSIKWEKMAKRGGEVLKRDTGKFLKVKSIKKFNL